MAPIRSTETNVTSQVRKLSGIGATEDQIDMRGTIGQRIDNKGTKLEDEAGTGQIDSSGGIARQVLSTCPGCGKQVSFARRGKLKHAPRHFPSFFSNSAILARSSGLNLVFRYPQRFAEFAGVLVCGVGLFLALDQDLIDFPAIEQARPLLELRFVFGSEGTDSGSLFEIDGSSDLQPVLRPEIDRLESDCFRLPRRDG